MSLSHTNRRKAKKRARTVDEKHIAQQIRDGKMPRFHFVKVADKLERSEVRFVEIQGRKFKTRDSNKLTWAMRSTYNVLTKKEELK